MVNELKPCENRGCGQYNPDTTAGNCNWDWLYAATIKDCKGFTTTPTQSIEVARLKELEEREQKGLGACMMVQSQAKTIERLAGEVERAHKLLAECVENLDNDSRFELWGEIRQWVTTHLKA